MISCGAIIGVLMDTALGSDELEELSTIELLINMPVTVGQLKVTVRIFYIIRGKAEVLMALH